MDSSATLVLQAIFPVGEEPVVDPTTPRTVVLDMSSLDDRGLMERVVGGDPDAFATLYRRHERPLFNFLLRVTRNRPLAEDLLQETFTRVWRAARTWDPSERPEGSGSPEPRITWRRARAAARSSRAWGGWSGRWPPFPRKPPRPTGSSGS